jgi:predicted nucleic acid-binding Zn ribbon protein
MSTRKGSKKKDKGGHLSSNVSGLKLIQHKHCAVCGKAQLLEDKEVCSDDCRKTLDENIRKKKMWWIYIALLMGVLVVMFLLSSLL